MLSLAHQHDVKDALLLARMELTPQAVWFDGTTRAGAQQTPGQVARQVRQTMAAASFQRAVPTLVIYNIPGRDCSQYSAGGAPTDTAYQAWVTGFAQGLGNGKAVIIVEPDSLANDPSSCGSGAYAGETAPPTDASRFADIAFDVKALENDPNASVYLDAGHSAWQDVGKVAWRLVQSDVQQAQGFFLNVSNYQYTTNNVYYGDWVSDCIAYITMVSPSSGASEAAADGACPNQYWNGGPAGTEIATLEGAYTGVAMSPFGTWSETTTTADLNTSGIDARYASMLGSTQPTAHFVVDTSRNGNGPNDMSAYAAAPYNQPSSVVSTLQGGNWCNPPGAGLGLTPTADPSAVTSVPSSPLLDAFLWVKTPGQSDGQCDMAGGVRAWDDTAYTPPITGWPTPTSADWTTFDPLWSLQTGTVVTDPAAGAWFPQEALQLAQEANPPLMPFSF
jgi:endoglucanase